MKYLRNIFLLLSAIALLTGCGTWARIHLADDVWQANHRYKQEEYAASAVLYEQLVDKYPEGKTRQRMMLKIADCMYLYNIQPTARHAPALHDAASVYLDYLEQYPQGEYRKDAQQGLERIRAIQANRDQRAQQRLEQIADDVEKLKKAIAQNPYNAQLHLRYGNALWKLERYDEAVDAYLKSQEIDAALKEFELIKNRMTVDEKGRVQPITPEMRRQIEREANPLVIFEVNDYQSNLPRDFFAVRDVYYNVIGKVLNQSSRHLNNVLVQVDFYNAAHQLLDSKTVSVGNMSPGAVRVFNVKATNYDYLDNIRSYEINAFEN